MADMVLAAVTALNGLAASVKALSSLKSEGLQELRAELLGQVVDAHQAVLELQSTAMTLQTEAAACEKRVAELEEENRRFRDWESERDRYELKELRQGAFAYVAKETGAQGDKPLPHLCAHCFQNAYRSILQLTEYEGRTPVLTCPRCKNRLLGVTLPRPRGRPRRTIGRLRM